LIYQRQGAGGPELREIVQRLQMAKDIFLYPTCFDMKLLTCVPLRPIPDGRDLTALCGTLWVGMDAQDRVLGNSHRDGTARTTPEIAAIYRSGYRTPLALQLWMIPGARPCIAFSEASDVDLRAELARAGLPVLGDRKYIVINTRRNLHASRFSV